MEEAQLCSFGNLIRSWMLLGDFNEILLPQEVKGRDFSLRRAGKFAEVVDMCNLMDIGTTSSQYT